MAIDNLPHYRNWHERFFSASVCHGSAILSALTPVLCVENTKQSRLQGVVLTAPRMTRFQVIIRDQDGTNPFVRKRYVVHGPTPSSWGQCIDYRPWPLALVKWGANKEICVMVVSTFASGVPYTADLELLELMG